MAGALHKACRLGDVVAVRQLVESGSSVSEEFVTSLTEDASELTPLYNAAVRNFVTRRYC